jgi:hypothetical protein
MRNGLTARESAALVGTKKGYAKVNLNLKLKQDTMSQRRYR